MVRKQRKRMVKDKEKEGEWEETGADVINKLNHFNWLKTSHVTCNSQ